MSFLFLLAAAGLAVYAVFMADKFTLGAERMAKLGAIHIAVAVFAGLSFAALVLTSLDLTWLALLGVPLIAFGAYLAYSAFKALGKQTIVPGKEVVKEWPYSRIQHPMYVGTLIAAAGTFFLTLTREVFAYVVLLALAFAVVVHFEEKELKRRFGADYLDYQQRVPTMLPRR